MINILVFFCALAIHALKSFEEFFVVKFVKNLYLLFFCVCQQTFLTFWNFMFRTEIAFHLLSFPRSVSFLSSTVAGEDTSSASRNQRSLHRFENLIFFIFFHLGMRSSYFAGGLPPLDSQRTRAESPSCTVSPGCNLVKVIFSSCSTYVHKTEMYFYQLKCCKLLAMIPQ